MKRHAPLLLLAASLGLAACQGPGPRKVGEAMLAMAAGVEQVPAAAEDAPVVEILAGRPATIPGAPVVKLAIDRQATWGQVKASLDLMDARGQTPVLLVAERRKVRALERFDQVEELDTGAAEGEAKHAAGTGAAKAAEAGQDDAAGEGEAKAEAAQEDAAAEGQQKDAAAGEPDRPFAALRARAIELTAYTDGKVCVRHPDIAEAKCVQTPSKKYIDGAFTRQLVREAVEGYGLTTVAADLPVNLDWDDVVRVIDGARTCCQKRDMRVLALPPEAFPERVQVPAE